MRNPISQSDLRHRTVRALCALLVFGMVSILAIGCKGSDSSFSTPPATVISSGTKPAATTAATAAATAAASQTTKQTPAVNTIATYPAPVGTPVAYPTK